MSNAWFRGPVCGTDNCRLRVYRTADGLTICQYGHVVEGTIEINDEEDAVVTQTRRINDVRVDAHGSYVSSQSSKAQHKEAPIRLSGLDARDACHRCLQQVLQLQLDQIIKSYMIEAVRAQFTLMVKRNWIALLNQITCKSKRSRVRGRREPSENAGNEETAKSNTLFMLSALDTIAIIYALALQLRQYPLYAIDLLRGVRLGMVGYCQNSGNVLMHLYEMLLPKLKNLILPIRLPSENVFINTLQTWTAKLNITEPIGIYHYLPFCHKVLSHDLEIPNYAEVYAIIVYFANAHRSKLETMHVLADRSETAEKNIATFPEIVVCGLIIEVIYQFLCTPQLWHEGVIFNPENWIRHIDDRLESIDFLDTHASKLDLCAWLDSKVENYCAWVQTNLLPKSLLPEHNHDATPMEKRLWLTFTVPESRTLSLDINSTTSSADVPGRETCDVDVVPSPAVNAQYANNLAHVRQPITPPILADVKYRLFSYFARASDVLIRTVERANDAASARIGQGPNIAGNKSAAASVVHHRFSLYLRV